MRRLLYEILFFIGVEGFIFSTFYLFLYYVVTSNISLAGSVYMAYEYGSPALLVLLIYYDHDLREAALKMLRSKEVFLLIGAIFVWGYIFALYGFSLQSLFYAPAIIDEINFRLVATNFFSKFSNRGASTVIQATMFSALYANYLLFEPQGYPGLYAPLYLIDMFMMGILYGALYFLRKNIYLDVILHNSLYILSYIVPMSLAWIPYVMLPS